MLNIQRQFGATWAVEVGYLGSVSHHMAGFWNQNQGVPSTIGPASSHLPFGDYTFIQTVQDMGNAEYNSLAVKVNKRFSGGLSLITAYTYGVAIDDTRVMTRCFRRTAIVSGASAARPHLTSAIAWWCRPSTSYQSAKASS
jgi:long-subunit fatty acid transport protein